jgi:hypothetical protein
MWNVNTSRAGRISAGIRIRLCDSSSRGIRPSSCERIWGNHGSTIGRCGGITDGETIPQCAKNGHLDFFRQFVIDTSWGIGQQLTVIEYVSLVRMFKLQDVELIVSVKSVDISRYASIRTRLCKSSISLLKHKNLRLIQCNIVTVHPLQAHHLYRTR